MFKPGDIVRCINNESAHNQLTLNKDYEVLETVLGTNNTRFVVVKTDMCKEYSAFESRFVLSKRIEEVW